MISDEYLQSSRILQDGVIFIPQSYKIVEKEETRVLIRVLDECRTIYKAYSVMSIHAIENWEQNANMIQMMNLQILHKLNRMFRYYRRHYGVDIYKCGMDRKAMADNIEDICESIRSWEE